MTSQNQEPRTENQEYTYRNLILWQKAQQLTLKVVKLVAGLPERDRAADVIARQILRSSSSIGANVAEGHGRFSLGAHANYLSIAKGSACETDNWFDLLRRAGLLSGEDEHQLHLEVQEVICMLTRKIIDLDRMAKPRKTGYRVSDETAAYLISGEAGDSDYLLPSDIYGPEDYAEEDLVLGSGFSVQGAQTAGKPAES